ncbi:restriction endonuclease subunit S [Oceanobacter sp. 4_MG-2023]|uniref:restriction endonuclease subunit S n=1 Tax=Oceanobacter sp. 4_MG-2023 TaxID=3062623 RepID=UPI0027334412|nr:restriction endonuclease subunit S [Oceanobacter sp. 4_MG-2023]MDP2547316.1 restriction endonuclease subunit S [Oceanobacter sp. 4_MG-2023]
MNGKYQSYSELKGTGILGLEKIPTNWDLKRIKYLFSIGRGRVISGQELIDEGLYPVYSSQTKNNGCLGYIGTYDFDCKQITWTTDGANAGTVFLREGKHNCTNVCGTLQPKNNEMIMSYALYCLEYVTQFHKRPDTNGAKIMNNEMAEISITQPSALDQICIANFLDHETAKIDTLIDKQQQLIKLLKEKRQAVISHAVTKGLNPNAPMKDSGVEWLGEVPEHWDVLRLFRVGKIGQGCSFPHSIQGQETGELPWFKVMDMNSPGNEEVMSIAANCINYDLAARINTPVFQPDTIIFPRVGAALLTNKRRILSEPSVVDDNIYAFTPTKVHPRFAYMILQLIDMSTLCSPGLVPTITFSAINNVRIPLPPVDEQIVIVETIDTQSAKIQVLTQRAENVISLLKERRTALISAAVTGKIDVRNFKAGDTHVA